MRAVTAELAGVDEIEMKLQGCCDSKVIKERLFQKRLK